jgi:hypothetical protein
MNSRKPNTLLVCLVFMAAFFAGDAQAWDLKTAAFVSPQAEFSAPPVMQAKGAPNVQPLSEGKAITKVKPKKIVKCRPEEALAATRAPYDPAPSCVLPMASPGGWEMDVEAFFARTKGKVRCARGVYGYGYFGTAPPDVDLNSNLSLPDHGVVGAFSARYHFRPGWSVRYSIMPMAMEATGQPNGTFTFGSLQTFGAGQNVKTKWERIQQNIGMAYDPIRTYKSRVTVFGEYVRINEKLSVYQVGCCGDAFDNDLNMVMAGLEFERCLRTSRLCNTLSCECKVGIACGDDAFGADISTALRYSIPLRAGRWGFIKGGYRHISFNKKYSDFKLLDTAMEGGFVQMGFIF